MAPTFIFDVDSTVISRESLDEILLLSLQKNSKKEEKMKEIEHITQQGMNGEITMRSSLSSRLRIAEISQKHIDTVTQQMNTFITQGIEEAMEYIQKKGGNIFLVSGGFLENILPLAVHLHIPSEHCFGNTFLKKEGKVVGVDEENPLSRNGGKSVVIQKYIRPHVSGKIISIGDGISDAETFLQGYSDEFWGFFLHVSRPALAKKATKSFFSSEDFLTAVKDYF